jgi:hypothetical protein
MPVRSVVPVVAAAIAVLAIDGDSTALADRQYAVIVLTALAMGLRNATVQQLAVPGLTTTTVLTMTMTGLAADFALTDGSHPHLRGPSTQASIKCAEEVSSVPLAASIRRAEEKDAESEFWLSAVY